uniref:UPAR/Ly6 domain-containing protein n=1 Tax=Myripristis murdjan TaxID=586833 RepID=A0A667WNH2_9TELE
MLHSHLPSVCGLKCFTCWNANPGSCTQIWSCPAGYDRCSTTIAAENLITKNCMRSDECNMVDSTGLRCCDKDLCNRARHTGASVSFLLVSLAFFTVFL